ncbi:CBP80/20-dependent translation initiation factor [Penaeus vannamei]|uniref:CBP80/20-dependent translation initiation factor n=1 Tax=Penaeus vannamei TaxID=6689 RepID=UPI000F67BA89|nr:CBP80/20-dependent translation initiation factor-like [Penaeus vannamei]
MPQAGRGRGMTVGQGEALRRPGPVNNGGDTARAKTIVDSILKIKSPDDLQLQDLASEIKSTMNDEEELKWFVEELCTQGLSERNCAPVAAKLFGLIAQHHAGESKIRTLLLRRVQSEYAKKDDLAVSDWSHFVTSALFLGEVFYHVKSEQNTPFKVLAAPVLKYLEMIIQPNLDKDANKNIDDDMIVVSRQLLLNGAVLHEAVPSGVLEVVQSVTKILCLCQLSTATRLNLLAALAEMWPMLDTNNDIRTQHALLATSIGVSLDI